MPATYYYINDAGGNTWQLGVTDDGILTTEATSVQAPPALNMNGASYGDTSFYIGVTTVDGYLTTTPVTYNAAYPIYKPLFSPGGLLFYIGIDQDGILDTQTSGLPVPFLYDIPLTMLVDWSANSGIYDYPTRLGIAIYLVGLVANPPVFPGPYYPWFNLPQFQLAAISLIQNRAATNQEYTDLIAQAGGLFILELPPPVYPDETPPQAY